LGYVHERGNAFLGPWDHINPELNVSHSPVPIHTSKRIAKRSGLPGVILQGTATLALAARELINRNAGGDPLRLKSISCRFTGMVLPGTEIKIRLLDSVARDSGTNLFFSVLNQDGHPAISNGYARIRG